jgi:hypothetical protein
MVSAVAGVLISCSGTEPTPSQVDFVIGVGPETFVLRSSDVETIRLLMDNLRGANSLFPIGPVREGDGGFNAPWSWHLDPDETRMTEAAVEVCDGLPSYVEAHRSDFPTYCPWSGRVLGAR